jgi:hypothetical protein
MEGSFDELFARLGRGDSSAAEEICRLYTKRLIGLARNRLTADIARKVGPEDVIQSVFRTFFTRQKDGQFDQLADWDELWWLLSHITATKCNRKMAEFYAACRDIRREVGFQIAGSESGAVWDAISPDPTASDAAMLIETTEIVVRDLSTRDRRIVELALGGAQNTLIAKEIGCAERTVERVLKIIRKRIERMIDADKDGAEGGPVVD